MAGLSIFIGVVSYPGTRFATSQGPDGLGARLAAELTERDANVKVVIDTHNRWGETPIAPEEVQRALTAQVRVEGEWVRYLAAGEQRGARAHAKSALRWARRAYRRVVPPDPRFVTRLLNIELAHRLLLTSGCESGAEWIVILEDDAYSADVSELAQGLISLCQSVDSSVSYINLSESFELRELGVDSLLEQTNVQWAGASDRKIMAGSRPVTNTVCAIAYRAEFARALLAEFESLPMFPVIPIDWKLNRALMNMYQRGDMKPGSCVWVVPGPIDQMSMRNDS